MKCPGCHQDTLSLKKLFWTDINSPTQCPRCKTTVVIKRTWSRAYWALQISGLIIGFLFIGFYFYGMRGAILAFCFFTGIGCFIRFIECKYVGLTQVALKEKDRDKCKKKTSVIFILIFYLVAFAILAIKING